MYHPFGIFSKEHGAAFERAAFHAGNLYTALLDEVAMWNPATLDDLVRDFPKNLLPEADLYLVLSECIANAAMHAKAKALGFHARRRGTLIMLCFYQIPPMPNKVLRALAEARKGTLPPFPSDLSGGLGFPILLRLTRHVSISRDRHSLRLWFLAQDFIPGAEDDDPCI